MIRIGLLLNDMVVPSWAARLVDEIERTGIAEIVLLILDDSGKDVAVSPLWQRVLRHPIQIFGHAFDRVLDIIDRRVIEVALELPDAFEMIDVSSRLKGIKVARVVPVRSQWSDRIPDADCAAIESERVDILVRLGFRILRGRILSTARYGVWSFHHGDNRVNRGGPPGYWEVAEGWPVTGCVLQALSEDLDNGLVLAKTWSSTDQRSVAQNRNALYWKSLMMLPRQLIRLHRDGGEKYLAVAASREFRPRMYSNRLYRRPNAFEHAKHTAARLWRRLRNAIVSRLYDNQWALIYKFSSEFATSLWRFTRFDPPIDRFYADPFVVRRDGRYFVFFEEFIFAKGHGHISTIEFGQDGPIGMPEMVLDIGSHLSYPFVFEFAGDLWMIPESRRSLTISLYRCTEFPGCWVKVIDLFTSVDAVDTSVTYRDGKWWLFTNIVQVAGSPRSDELYLFYSNDLVSDKWTPHPMNPVVSDVRSARCAGRLFERDGRLYRPSQDCSVRYGWALNFCEIDLMSETEYSEHLVSKSTPDWNSKTLGIHTFNSCDQLFVADVLVKKPRWRAGGQLP